MTRFHHPHERPHRQGYYRCLFTDAPHIHHRVWWSGKRWELRGHPLDIETLSAWYG